MESQYFIDIFLPEFVSATFDVVDMISSESCIDIYLDEKKIIPPDISNSRVISHGFTPSTTIENFPARGKAVHLHLKYPVSFPAFFQNFILIPFPTNHNFRLQMW